eukprot:TRINITY_DN4942_c0_g3_i3.p1 TRINITY_DN4942_c0_g3~~TRINITY_DN4942_c0_g3_i3.p1  ORF type:complete len:504 (-),score=135.39 TRINITY_DN4942_c0_g3_i3:15-1526(-)
MFDSYTDCGSFANGECLGKPACQFIGCDDKCSSQTTETECDALTHCFYREGECLDANLKTRMDIYDHSNTCFVSDNDGKRNDVCAACTQFDSLACFERMITYCCEEATISDPACLAIHMDACIPDVILPSKIILGDFMMMRLSEAAITDRHFFFVDATSGVDCSIGKASALESHVKSVSQVVTQYLWDSVSEGYVVDNGGTQPFIVFQPHNYLFSEGKTIIFEIDYQNQKCIHDDIEDDITPLSSTTVNGVSFMWLSAVTSLAENTKYEVVFTPTVNTYATLSAGDVSVFFTLPKTADKSKIGLCIEEDGSIKDMQKTVDVGKVTGVNGDLFWDYSTSFSFEGTGMDDAAGDVMKLVTDDCSESGTEIPIDTLVGSPASADYTTISSTYKVCIKRADGNGFIMTDVSVSVQKAVDDVYIRRGGDNDVVFFNNIANLSSVYLRLYNDASDSAVIGPFIPSAGRSELTLEENTITVRDYKVQIILESDDVVSLGDSSGEILFYVS